MLSKLSWWEERRVVLDPRIVLGRNLLGDRSRRYIRFAPEDRAAIVVRREKLIDASKALKFIDIACSLDERGLRFEWRGGVGGLLLTTQQIEARYRDAVLHVEVLKPRPAVPTIVAPPRRERASSWVGDVFGELSPF
jgi:hypothetical protein